MRTILAIAVALTLLNTQSKCALVPGDIAIVRANSQQDGISILALRDIDMSEELFATDSGWLAQGGFRNAEGQGNVDIVTTTISKGTVFDVTSFGTSFSLSQDGDQVILFTGAFSTPTLLYAIDWGNGQGWNPDATDTQTSADPAVAPIGSPALPDELTVSLPSQVGYKYTGIKTGTPEELLAAIANVNNWIASTDVSWTDGNFNVVPEPAEWGLMAVMGLMGVCGWRTWRERRRLRTANNQ